MDLEDAENAAPLRSDFMERIVTQRRLNFQTR